MKLTFKVLINAETPTKWMNAWDSDSRDLANTLKEIVGDSVDESETTVNEAPTWHDFRTLDGEDSVYQMAYNGEIDRDGIEKLALNGYLYSPCPTLGMLCEDGWYPAVSFELEMQSSYASFYLCPLVDGEVPNEVNFNRIIRAIENL